MYDADLQSYFDTIPHEQLLKCLERRIVDRAVLKLIRLWLETPVLETDESGRTTATRPRQGTPQGGVISPLLANVYLHWFEKAFTRRDGPGTWAKAQIVRYADDFVVLARYQSRRLIDWIEGTLEGRFRLTINRAKTRVVRLRQPGASLTFLGFTLRYDRDRFGRDRRYLNVFPSSKALARARMKLRELLGPHRNFVPIPALVVRSAWWLGAGADTSVTATPAAAFTKLNWYVSRRFLRHLHASESASPGPGRGTFHAHLRRLGVQFL